jgi:hypothetical protein
MCCEDAAAGVRTMPLNFGEVLPIRRTLMRLSRESFFPEHLFGSQWSKSHIARGRGIVFFDDDDDDVVVVVVVVVVIGCVLELDWLLLLLLLVVVVLVEFISSKVAEGEEEG